MSLRGITCSERLKRAFRILLLLFCFFFPGTGRIPQQYLGNLIGQEIAVSQEQVGTRQDAINLATPLFAIRCCLGQAPPPLLREREKEERRAPYPAVAQF